MASLEGELAHRVGFLEWVSLPELNLPWIKAKVDTGARTSALHADPIEIYDSPDGRRVRFTVHPVQKRWDLAVPCDMPLLEEREVRSSSGKTQQRAVIETMLTLDGESWPVELTLTNREKMKLRMLLGRTAIAGKAWVNPGVSYLLPRPHGASKFYRPPTH